MRCAQCQVENREGRRFCAECGAPLALACSSCGFTNEAGEKFCGGCGILLTEPTPASRPTQTTQPRDQTHQVEPPRVERGAPPAERRQLTVLFCDLVDSTALSSQLDPEEWREVVRAYQATCAEVIERFEGHIAQYLGDGLLVYFGYPQAHEDNAQRAVRAALGMVEAIGQLNTSLERERRVRLGVRLGIHTGLVVVGVMGGGARQEQLALGETPNLAARLQGLAAPDTVVISAATYQLVQGLFACRALGPHMLKGISTAVLVYRVLGESGVQTRLEIAGPSGLTPLVGREQEVGLLLERWAQVQEGLGQVVLLSGEAGIGKSRLVQVVKEHVAGEPHVRWDCRCSPYSQHSPLYPVIDLFQRTLQWQRDEAPEEKFNKLERALAHYHVPPSDVVPSLATLLSLPLPDRYSPLTRTPQRQRQKTLEAVLGVLLALAAQQPVLFIVEDLHWVDPSTLELLSLLLDQVSTTRIFTLLTARPEFRSPWATRAHLALITLNRLPHTQAEAMVEQMVGKILPVEVRQQIVTKTDGVPLFVEELTKMVLESGLLWEQEARYVLTGPLPPLAIPATLHDSLMARLDRLAAVKAVAQLGATLGRAFSYELLHAVSPLDETALQQALTQFVEAGLLYQRGLPPQATYVFKHALVQETAYQSLLKSRRQQAHQQIALVLETRFPEAAETQPELLAHHYTEAGLRGQAIRYWQRAGQRALERSAHVEAIGHLTTGLEIVAMLPETHEHIQQELALQMGLGQALIATKGAGAPEVEHAYTRARELCQRMGDTPQRFRVLWGLYGFYVVRADLQTAWELGEQLLSLAQRAQDPELLLEAHHALGMVLFLLGELVPAQAHLEQGIALHDPQQRHAHAFLYVYVRDTRVVCLSYMALALWVRGYPDQALQRSQEALTLAQELSHPQSLVYALFYAALLYQYYREGRATQKRAETVIVLAREQEFTFWVAGGTLLRGWALAEQGQGEDGITQMCQGLAAWRASGAELGRPYFLALVAEGCGKMGPVEEGLTLLAEALAAVHNTGERWCEVELYRLKGELLLARSGEDHGEAEACFRQALETARRQGAKSLELRAAMSLSRLWQQQGKGDEARELLAPIYGWFTEGFDTADLQEAKVLLEELSPPASTS